MLSITCCRIVNSRQYRIWLLLWVTITMTVLMASFYFQFVQKLEPCPLCLMQRFSVMILLALSMMALFMGVSARAITIARLQMIIALAGLYFAGRQLWLQWLPETQTPSCLPGLDVLMRFFPWQDVAKALFLGAGECAEVSWRWLGLTMPAWAALYFIAMFLAGLINLKFVTRYKTK